MENLKSGDIIYLNDESDVEHQYEVIAATSFDGGNTGVYDLRSLGAGKLTQIDFSEVRIRIVNRKGRLYTTKTYKV